MPAPKAKGTRGQLIGRGVIGGAPGDPPISGPPYQKKPTGSAGYPRREPPTRADYGLTKKDVRLAKFLAALPEQEFESIAEGSAG